MDLIKRFSYANIYGDARHQRAVEGERSCDDWDSFTYANWARLYDILQPVPGIALV